MRRSLLPILICPQCAAAPLALEVTEEGDHEIREGTLRCADCGGSAAIERGIVHALHRADPTVLAEARGWVRLLEIPEKAYEFRDEWVAALPFLSDDLTPDAPSIEIWRRLGEHLLDELDRVEVAGKRVLEIGASRGWAVAELARRGAEPIALDILTHRYLGLESGEIWFEREGLYFERILGDMHHLPIASDSLDMVLTTASLHHTHRLPVALAEIARVLRPGGWALFVNEPVIPDGAPPPDLSNDPETLHDIIEARPTLSEWLGAFRDAGLVLERLSLTDGLHVRLRKPRRFSSLLLLRDRAVPPLLRMVWTAAAMVRRWREA